MTFFILVHAAEPIQRKWVTRRGEKTKREGSRFNPALEDSSISVCDICSSTMHWVKQCLHEHEQQKTDVFAYAATRSDDCNGEECIEVTLCTAAGACRNNHRLLEATARLAFLDSGCHRTVCGERWLSTFTSCVLIRKGALFTMKTLLLLSFW